MSGTGAPSATGRDGIRSLAVALAAAESAASGRSVTIPD
jgi:1,5-anhydro-D-fructose reductase (1,5-anhydro-D-mannitol-forming)